MLSALNFAQFVAADKTRPVMSNICVNNAGRYIVATNGQILLAVDTFVVEGVLETFEPFVDAAVWKRIHEAQEVLLNPKPRGKWTEPEKVEMEGVSYPDWGSTIPKPGEYQGMKHFQTKFLKNLDAAVSAGGFGKHWTVLADHSSIGPGGPSVFNQNGVWIMACPILPVECDQSQEIPEE